MTVLKQRTHLSRLVSSLNEEAQKLSGLRYHFEVRVIWGIQGTRTQIHLKNDDLNVSSFFIVIFIANVCIGGFKP